MVGASREPYRVICNQLEKELEDTIEMLQVMGTIVDVRWLLSDATHAAHHVMLHDDAFIPCLCSRRRVFACFKT